MKRRAIFIPDWSKGNPYQNMLKRALGELGIDVALRDPPAGFFPLNRIVNEEGRVAVLHLHWINDLVDAIIWSKSALRRSAKIALLKLDIALVRLRGVKVIWTIHNLVAHESKDPADEIRVRKAIATTCTHVILHSASALALVEKTYDVSLAGKASVIPHGNYDGCYPLEADSASRLRAKFGLDADDIVILFFGAIRPYKGMERLIEAFRFVENKNLRLLVAGKAESAAFGESLGNLASSGRANYHRIGLRTRWRCRRAVRALRTSWRFRSSGPLHRARQCWHSP